VRSWELTAKPQAQFSYTVLCDISVYGCLSMNQFPVSLHFAILVFEEV